MAGRLHIVPILGALILMLAPMANAAAAPSYNQSILNASYQYANCKVAFTIGFLGDIGTAVPSLSAQMSGYSGAMTQDGLQLKAYASEGNLSAFRSYVSGSFDPELRKITSALTSDYNSSNMTANTVATLRGEYNASRAVYMNCSLGALKAYAAAKVGVYYSMVADYQNVSNSFSRLGVNTSSINSLLQNGTQQIIVPLQNEINASGNATQLFRSLQSLCLFNGCANGTNFHLDAKIYTDGLSLIYNRLSSARVINGTLLDGMHADILNATSTLQQVGAGSYSESQESYIFNQLSNAVTTVKDIVSSLRV